MVLLSRPGCLVGSSHALFLPLQLHRTPIKRLSCVTRVFATSLCGCGQSVGELPGWPRRMHPRRIGNPWQARQPSRLEAVRDVVPGPDEAARNLQMWRAKRGSLNLLDLTVLELKEDLAMFGQPTSGNKSSLIKRLHATLGTQPEPEPTGTFNPRGMTVKMLQQWLKGRGVDGKGNKSDLIALAESTYAAQQREAEQLAETEAEAQEPFNAEGDNSSMTSADLKRELKARDLPVSGSKQELYDRYLAARQQEEEEEEPRRRLMEDIQLLTLDDLLKELRARGLPESGTRTSLRDTLVEAMLREEQELGASLPPGEELAQEWGLEDDEEVQQDQYLEDPNAFFVDEQAIEQAADAKDQQAYYDDYGDGQTPALDAEADLAAEPEAWSQQAEEPLDAPLTVAVICGGPSAERGISLNSARSLMDYLHTALRPSGPSGAVPDYGEGLQAGIGPGSAADNGDSYEYADNGNAAGADASGAASSSGYDDAEHAAAGAGQDQPGQNGGGAEASGSEEAEQSDGRPPGINVEAYYIDAQLRPYSISAAQLYSNTPSDFDFKLASMGEEFPSLQALAQHLKANTDIVFPAIHGRFGEGGELQRVLEEAGVPFVGSPSEVAAQVFHKQRAVEHMEELGFPVLDMVAISRDEYEDPETDWQEKLAAWFISNNLSGHTARVVVKPAQSGSSIGVSMQIGMEAAVAAVQALFEQEVDDCIIVEPFLRQSVEFTVVVLETAQGPVAMLPTEIEVIGLDREMLEAELEMDAWLAKNEGHDPRLVDDFYETLRGEELASAADGNMFTYRRKYLPTEQVRYRSPPRFPAEVVQGIREGAAKLFKELGMRDFARIDGWIVLPQLPHDYKLDLETAAEAGLDVEQPPEFVRGDWTHPGGDAEAEAEPEAGSAAQAAQEEAQHRASSPAWSEDTNNLPVILGRVARAALEANRDSEPAAPLDLKTLQGLDLKRQIDAMAPVEEDVYQATKGMARIDEAMAKASQNQLLEAVEALADAEDVDVSSLGPQTDWEDQVQEAREAQAQEQLEQEALFAEAEGEDDGMGDGLPDYEEEDERWALPDLAALSPQELCVTASGTIVFTDINVISGMEQNSFLFQQAAEVGLSHSGVLRHILSNACERHGLLPIPPPAYDDLTGSALLPPDLRQPSELEEALEALGEQMDRIEREQAEAAQQSTAGPWGGANYGFPDEAAGARYPGEYTSSDFGNFTTQYGRSRDSPLLPEPSSEAEASLRAAQEEERANDYNALEHVVNALPSVPQRVWVLMGGDTSERQVSLLSGANVYLKLRGMEGITAEPFLLAPLRGGLRYRERRQALLKQRNGMLQAGMPEEHLPPHLQRDAISRPELPDVDLERRGVWALTYRHLLRHTVEEVHESCEAALRVANIQERCAELQEKVAAELQQVAQVDLAMAGVAGVAGTWGGNPLQPPPAPRYLDLRVFAEEAREANAVVFLALHGGPGEDGSIQSFLEVNEVMFSGSGSLASSICIDKLATAEQLEALETQSISTAPKHPLTLAQVVDVADKEDVARELFDFLQNYLIGGPGPLCVKPASDGCSTGVARLDDHIDLAWYALALDSKWASLPANTLTQAHPEIVMPADPPEVLLFEPFIQADSLVITSGEDSDASADEASSSEASAPTDQLTPDTAGEEASGTGRSGPSSSSSDSSIVATGREGGEQLRWLGDSRWVEVTVGLLGEFGRMRALSPSLPVRTMGHVLTLEEKFQGGTGINLTPPPPDFVRPEVLNSVKARVELVADQLGLSGLARVDAFMHADTAEIIVIEVNTIPGMTPSTVLMQQALAEDPPLYPKELFLEVVQIAVAQSLENAEAEAQASDFPPTLEDQFEQYDQFGDAYEEPAYVSKRTRFAESNSYTPSEWS
ncbi:hypothetical protein WJX72_004090 [[Myrmecia] bisecta]|uniref:D-alanine--D-alanine ligase n=1 Tax=[Myrmecia] bisecta TaxID=41462 RepID=A0AAW1QF02_9CHLO